MQADSQPSLISNLERPGDRPGALAETAGGQFMALADNTPIPTPQGWTDLGDIAIGQQVFDNRGRPLIVTGVQRHGEQPVYRTELDDGSFLLAGAGNPWQTLTHFARSKIHKGTRQLGNVELSLLPFTTEDLRRSPVYWFSYSSESMHSIPLAWPLQLPERDLSIAPYLLGLWLGDGDSKSASITCHRDDEPHYRERARAAGENWRVAAQQGKKGNILRCVLSGEPPPWPSGEPRARFLTRLGELGVKGEKAVPPEYLRASLEQRLALLQGLMDSDGTIGEQGRAEYTSKSERLARGVLELALSLGQKATLRRGDAKLYGRRISDKWRVFFGPTLNVVSLPRKADRLREFLEMRRATPLSRLAQRYIREVVPAGMAATSGISVDSSLLVLAGRQMVPVRTTSMP